MDDPWGSPWASTENPPKPTAGIGLEAPPPVFVSDATATFSQPGQTPWADDDAFGDWNTAEPAKSPSGWALWTTEATTAAAPPLTPRGRKDNSAAWPGNTPHGRQSLALPSSASNSRHPSPDLYSSERYSPPRGISRLPSLEPVPSPLMLDEFPKGSAGIEEDTYNSNGLDSELRKDDKDVDGERQSTSGHGVVDSKQRTSTMALDSVVSTSEITRPVSELSTDSGFDEPLGPSLTMSDAGSALPTLPAAGERQVSKVRELVDMYDELSQKKEPAEPLPHATLGKPRSAAREGAGLGTEDASLSTAEASETEDEHLGSEARHSVDSSPTTSSETNEHLPIQEHSEDEFAPVRAAKHREPVPFDIDLTKLDLVYPNTDLPPSVDMDKDNGNDEVPDHIIRDSFGTISERKAWYRISRMGSSRLHDSGEDDSYVRVTWQGSAVKDETTKIVRRWMEEDSITGRPTLGAGAGRASSSHMFGWDSNAEPVQLDQIFKRKPPSQHARETSFPHSSAAVDLPSVQPSASVPRPSSIGNMELVPTTLASFGWSSTQPGSPVKQPEEQPVKQTPVASKISDEVTTLSSKTSHPINISHTKPASLTITSNDDDDEWGEMVSSPQRAVAKSTPNDWSSWDDIAAETAPLGGTGFTTAVPSPGAPDSSSAPFTSSWTTSNPRGLGQPFAFKQTPLGVVAAQPLLSANTGIASLAYRDASSPPATSPAASIQNGVLSAPTNAQTPRSPLAQVKPTALARIPERVDDTAFIQELVQSLPNLSYMFQ